MLESSSSPPASSPVSSARRISPRRMISTPHIPREIITSERSGTGSFSTKRSMMAQKTGLVLMMNTTFEALVIKKPAEMAMSWVARNTQPTATIHPTRRTRWGSFRPHSVTASSRRDVAIAAERHRTCVKTLLCCSMRMGIAQPEPESTAVTARQMPSVWGRIRLSGLWLLAGSWQRSQRSRNSLHCYMCASPKPKRQQEQHGDAAAATLCVLAILPALRQLAAAARRRRRRCLTAYRWLRYAL
jgi:hypothetical protein